MSAKKNKLKKSVSTLTSSLMQRGYFQWKKNKIRFKKWRKSIKASKEETLKLHVKRKKNWFKNFVRKSVSWITKKGLTEANLQLRTYLTILKDWSSNDIEKIDYVFFPYFIRHYLVIKWLKSWVFLACFLGVILWTYPPFWCHFDIWWIITYLWVKETKTSSWICAII